jgi:hypothetical protein
MDVWQFMDYISVQGRNAITDWYDRLLSQEQTDFDTMIRILAKTRQWRMPEFRWIKGRPYAGLGEIRFTSERKQHRVVGFYGPRQQQFTMLIGCTHKQNIYNPPNALDTAARRKREIETGDAGVQRHDL